MYYCDSLAAVNSNFGLLFARNEAGKAADDGAEELQSELT
jgi:hypothetical protein